MDTKAFLDHIPHRFSNDDKELIARAFEFAHQAHEGQKRKSGEDFISHPVQSAIILGGVFPDTSTIIATLLHDITEDTKVTKEELTKDFGQEISELVDGVTKLGKVRLRNSKEPMYMENLRKMFLATSRDVRVILVKLADRLHNMRTIASLPPDKQVKIASETLEVFAPIASRLGIGVWKDELEDLSFSVVNRKDYMKAKEILEKELASRTLSIKQTEKELASNLRREGVKFTNIKSRTKRLYSLHKKLQKYDGDISKIYDIYAVRVITKSSADCYAVMGAIHKAYQPVPGRIKDFIATPKPNGYQSLHTSVFDSAGKVFEIQIRTDLMDEEAERGIAAHWFYSESGKRDELHQNKTRWIQDLHSWREKMQNDDEYLEALKIDFFQDRIFALTPKGDVKDLPKDASVIDFAFSIHSDLGYYMMGAKINGKMASIYDTLEQGDVVEILKTKKPATISRDWLTVAKTSLARHQIRQYLAEHDKGLMRRIRELKLEDISLPKFFRKQ